MGCSQGWVRGCANAQDLDFTYAAMNPVGIVPGVSKAKGVIVFLTGQDGTMPVDGATGTPAHWGGAGLGGVEGHAIT